MENESQKKQGISEATTDNNGVVYSIPAKRESLEGFTIVDTSALQDLKDRLKDIEKRCYDLNRDVGALSVKVEFWDKWKLQIILAAAVPFLISVIKSIYDLFKE